MVHGPEPALAEAVAGDIGGDAAWFAKDLTDSDGPSSVVESVVSRFGRLDILINNAAVTTWGDLSATDSELFDRTMAINAKAPLLLIREALPHFEAVGGGTVLNIGSVNAYSGEPDLLAYSMSKGALMTMTRNLSCSLAAKKIRVNQINVGWTLTPREHATRLSQGFSEDWESRLPKEYVPSGRLLSVDEIASYAVAFVEKAGGFVTGAVFEAEQWLVVGRNPAKEVV